jgi:hypothetical protein
VPKIILILTSSAMTHAASTVWKMCSLGKEGASLTSYLKRVLFSSARQSSAKPEFYGVAPSVRIHVSNLMHSSINILEKQHEQLLIKPWIAHYLYDGSNLLQLITRIPEAG